MKKLWKKFKQKLIHLLEDKENEETRETGAVEKIISPISKSPGLDCPNCHYRIPVRIEDLVIQNAVICNNCSLKLSVDLGQSQASIDELKKVYTAIQKTETFKETVK